jgi:nucleoside-diphosphate-sugar epimerase
MHVLVTGSSGTIGTHLCKELLKAGHTVTGIDWRKNEWEPEVDAITIDSDLRKENAFDEVPEGIDIVIHLAANARVYDLVEDPSKARDNILTVFNTLEYTRTHGIKRFIFASSRECYGNIEHKALSEDMARIEECESPYTASKVSGEALVHAYQSCYDIDNVIFRFSNVYGAYDNSDRVVPLFIRQAKAGEPLNVFGKEKYLDFTYIEDTTKGIIQSVEKFDEVKNDTFNLAYGEGTSIVRVAEAIRELTGSSSEIVVGDSRTGEIIHYVADISKAKDRLGYDPKTTFEEGIKKSVEWCGRS